MPFGSDLALSTIPTLGSLGAAAIQRNWALKDWQRVNEYNHPKNQIARNKEAGLPLAAMFSQGGSTSSDVRSTNVDPTLGTAKGLENFFTNRMQKKQLELLEDQIYTEKGRGQIAWKEAGLKANELTLSNDRLQYEINAEGSDRVAPAYQPPSNQVQSMIRDRQTKDIEKFIKSNQNRMLQLERDIKASQWPLITEEIRNRVYNLILQSNLYAQEINRNSVIDSLINQIKKDGMSMGEAFMHSILTGGIRANITR